MLLSQMRALRLSSCRYLEIELGRRLAAIDRPAACPDFHTAKNARWQSANHSDSRALLLRFHAGSNEGSADRVNI